MAVTIKDVAKEAGVALSTASVVLQGKPHPMISKATIDRIWKVARDLDFRPNPTAQSLRSRKTMRIGLIADMLRWNHCPDIIVGIEEFFQAQGYQLVVGFSQGSAERELLYVREMVRGQVDALLVQPASDPKGGNLEYYRSLEFPLVLLEGPDDAGLPSVKKDRQMGIQLCMRHLYQLGRRHIGLALVSRDGYMDVERMNGYQQVLSELGLPYEEELVIYGGTSIEAGYEEVDQVLRLMPPMDGIICVNDEVALGLLRGLHEHGLDLPADLSVVGFADTMSGKYNFIPLTTLNQRYEMSSRRAAELLWEIMNRGAQDAPHELQTIVVAPILVVRESCGAAVLTPRSKA